MSTARTEADTRTSVPRASLGWRLLFGGLGMVLGLVVGLLIWGFDVLAHQHHDYTVTGLTLALILAGIGFFVPAKRGWRDTFLYFLLLSFLDN